MAGPEDKKLKGVGGWLLLLCLNLSILDPLTVLVSLLVFTQASKPYFDQQPELFRMILVSGIFRIALAVFSMYAGLALWRVLPGAVKVARRYFICLFLYLLLSLFLPALLGVPGQPSSQSAATDYLNVAITTVYVILWYIYLGKSKRVRSTYGGSE
jgi:hypothetical protein